MKPVYKIETKTGAVLDHTITDEAVSIYFKEILTSGVGHFSFSVPAMKGKNYYYDDIAVNDTVRIWLCYDTVPANPHFIGKVGKISGLLSTPTGLIRTVSGLSQGEILLRRQKKNKFYNAIGASTIVTEWATDLGINHAADITADATAVTLEVKTKTYFDLLQWISDYWANAGSQIKKDFLVDLDGHLHWKTRPIRTAGVETLTVGENIISYLVDRLVENVRNDITVYGAAEKPIPVDKDSWTETLDNWSASVGTVALSAAGPKKGAQAIRGTNDATTFSTFKRTIPRQTIRNINNLYFWLWTLNTCTWCKLRIHAPDNANYFEKTLDKTSNAWHFQDLALGPNMEYDAVDNPNGIWLKQGSPNWWDMQALEFHSLFSIASNQYNEVDALYFFPERWTDNATDAASIAAYEQRDLEVTDDKLHSDSDCQKRGETMLFQMKDPPTQITVTVAGNDNILVGDRLSMTIPAENISAANYDVLSVEQSLTTNGGFRTKATMVDSANVRAEMETSPLRTLAKLYKQVKAMNINELTVR